MVSVALGRWQRGVAASTAKVNTRLLESFFRFCGLTPDEAVAFQQAHLGAYRFVDAAYQWLEQNRRLSVNTMEMRMGIIRGFFLANRAPLPRDKHRFHSDKTLVVGELSVDEFRKILLSCNVPDYKAALLVQFQSGSGRGELNYINRHHAEHVWREVKRNRRIIRLTLPGRKANRNRRPYYTFIGSDAVEALSRLFHHRGWTKPAFLFLDQYGHPVTPKALSSYFTRHAIKAGVIRQQTWPCLECGGETVKQLRSHRGVRRTVYLCTQCHVEHQASEYAMTEKDWGGLRYRVRTHELRDLFRTQWHRAQRYAAVDPDAGEFFMGHSIDRDAYDKIMKDVAEARRQYRLAVPWLNVVSEMPDVVARSEVEDRLSASEGQVEVLSRELALLRKRQQVFEHPLFVAWLEEKMHELEAEQE